MPVRVACALLWMLIPVQAQPGTAPNLEQKIDAYTRPLVEQGDLGGTILIAREGEVLLCKGYGLANLEHRVPCAPNTRYGIASLSKIVTRMAVQRLIDREVFDWDDPVGRFIPGFPSADELTIRHLAYHRGGVAHHFLTREQERDPWTPATLVEILAKRPLAFRPGTNHMYSSGGYSVLARILEIATGKDYDAVLREEIYEPCGMTATIHADQLAVIPRRADDYRPGLSRIERAPFKDFSSIAGGGSLFSTAPDLNRFVDALRDGTLIADSDYLKRRADSGGGVIRMTGRAGGYQSFIDVHDEPGLTIIYLGNVQTGAQDLLRRDLPKIVSGQPYEIPDVRRPRGVALSRRILDQFVGRYRVNAGFAFEVVRAEDRLLCEGSLMIPTGPRTFFYPQRYAEVVFIADDSGDIVRADWTQVDGTWPCPKID